MIIVNVPTQEIADKEGVVTPPWGNFFYQTTQQMQLCLSEEGFLIPSVSSDPNSVTPPATGGQIAQLEASFGQQDGVLKGTMIFDPAEVNGATGGNPPNGQLKILLADGVFHKITNT